MDRVTHNKIVSFIWGIADEVLRDLFKRGKYPDVILPMCVIRRMDAVLEPTKKAVLETKMMLDEARITEQRAALCDAAGQAFYNTSKLPGELAVVLDRHGIGRTAIDRETTAMAEVAFAKTANRSVLGVMNEFAFIAEIYRERMEPLDLSTLSMRLADTPCSPIGHSSPAQLMKEVFTAALR
jgi:type I restriction-modification system DNA methylase subunit